MTKVVQYPDKSNNPAFAFTIADDTAILHYTESLQNFVSTHGPFIFNAIKDLIPTLQGAQGPAGKDGVDGRSAYELAVASGFSGTGAEWLASLKGKNGINGADGKAGQDGTAGVAGRDGVNGQDGQSAYELAVANGFNGTETQWLASLKGAKGDTGAVGPQGSSGKDGVTGAQGPAGKNGVDGKNGQSAYELAVTSGFTGTESEWLTSLKGKDGAAGSGTGGDFSLSVDSVMDLVRDAINLHVDVTTGELIADNKTIDQSTFVGAVAAKVLPMVQLSLKEPDLYAEIGGDN